MNEETILNIVKKSINDYCIKQVADPSRKIFKAILNGDKNSPILLTNANAIRPLLRQIFDYQISAWKVDIIDGDSWPEKTIVSLIQGGGERWQIAYSYGSGEEE